MAVNATYRYLFADLRSQQFFAELPMTRVSFTSKLNDIGSFSGDIHLADSRIQQAFVPAATTPGRTAIYVERNGVLIWSGILWTRRYSSSDHVLQVAGRELLSLFQRRYITVVKSYTNADQLNIVRDLVAHAQSATGANIGLIVSAVTSGVSRTLNWQPTDYKSIWDALHDLAGTDQGFDISITAAYTGVQSIALALNLGYPRLGRIASATGLVWEFPNANILSYQWPEDGTVLATKVYALGAGSGPTMLVASSGSPALIDAGYPLLESTYQWKDITNPSVLAAHARTDAKAFGQPAILPQITVRADREPILGSFVVGDDFRMRVTDPWFPAIGTGPGLDTYLRIVEVRVTPMDAGTAEQVIIVAGAPPTF